MVKRDFPLLAAVKEQLSHLLQHALWMPSLKEVIYLIPNSLCTSVSRSSTPHTDQHPHMPPLELGCTPSSHSALLGLHRTGFHPPKSLAGPAGVLECAPPRAGCLHLLSGQTTSH